ncbi:hypothetical protein ASAC_1192 [Acidilobus saccharovorans 345-15]|uniref:Uncharacterized protein n=1 Tax=Acidilobus saccharovorans (strain DSM 16705 / JCM 18335 / VKM B-2471 / 345-15) TaxID=666510 RepID=D9Q2Q9_ACIS3|nr:hypothetical protein [Acidilobus saccharovorans]ADL19597.1 hypothetical protein ASAC_1192 [Acidilobus saccharovorans 345-15]
MEQGNLKEVTVEFSGSRFRAFIDTSSGLLVCPICRRTRVTSPEDLVAHILAHAMKSLDKRREPPQRAHVTSESSSEE